jgi:hypothetical protein
MPFPTPVTKQRRQKFQKISLPPDRVEDQISIGYSYIGVAYREGLLY